MTPEESDRITRDRFDSWAGVLKTHTATPAVLVSIGHGDHMGEVHVVQVVDISRHDLIVLLEYTLRQLRKKGGAR